MARYKQVYDPETKTSTFVEIGKEVRSSGHFVQGDLQSFVSPIDGREISDRSQLRAHNKEHGVTNSADYSHDYMMGKAKQRQNEILGNTKENDRAIGQELYNRLVHAENR